MLQETGSSSEHDPKRVSAPEMEPHLEYMLVKLLWMKVLERRPDLRTREWSCWPWTRAEREAQDFRMETKWRS